MVDIPTTFSPVRQERRHESVARQLRTSILSGSYRPGDRLPKEQTLMDEFQVSRSAVRQALQLLERQGLVEVRVGSGGGAFVTDTDLTPILDAFANLFALRAVNTEQFVAAKTVIEPVISAAAAENITDEQLRDLRDNLAATEEAISRDGAVLDVTLDFHRIMARATANPVMELMLIALTEIAAHLPDFQEPPKKGWKRMLSDHWELYEALKERDPERVHQLMCSHLGSVSEAFARPQRSRAKQTGLNGRR